MQLEKNQEIKLMQRIIIIEMLNSNHQRSENSSHAIKE